ncbi:MAG TPA: hypothetical protein VMR17_23320 [Xanthobacteraceae bacterium]|nr:hypothetical protein [Xanthobacteraceae bacterium]
MQSPAPHHVEQTGIRPIALWDPECVIGGVLLAAVLIVGLATATDYGITTDEFIFDAAGPKALAWYTSGFTDQSLFAYYDTSFYGPWFQILVAAAQSLHLADPFTVRHALTFVVGLLGIAALLPIGRLAIGPWAGLTAVVLCLTTGNLYGGLFFTPNDVPFLAAMTWATLAIVVMAKRPVPSWPATVAAGLLTGLAIATRFGGVLSQAYLVGAMALCAFAAVAETKDRRGAALLAIGLRTLAALVLAWLTAIAIWPWLQAPNPFARFAQVYAYFIRSYVQFDFPAWGRTLSSGALPWHYIPGQLLARLPEGFIALLVIAALFGVVAAGGFVRDCSTRIRQNGFGGVLVCGAELAQSRGLLVMAVAALGPPLFVIVRGSVIFDALRHLLFILPMLALIAGWALVKLLPLLRRMPLALAGVAALHIAATVPTLVYLHPLEYVAMNGFAGGVAGASGRFDLDYWSAAATTAVRQLEARLDRERPARFATREPRVMVCIGWREPMVGPIFRKPWIVATDPRQADFVIEPQRWPCLHGAPGTVIDTVQRFGVTFATTFEMAPPASSNESH